MIIDWCFVSVVALIVGGTCSIYERNSDYFLGALALAFCIGFGSVLVTV